jgi:phosphopantothenoylcysteine decarboxylase/phosphopantothenate--cysteine ligase
MGQALGEEAVAAGAEVDFVSGPVPAAHLPRGVRLVQVVSAEEMLQAARARYATADFVIYAAAVADFRPRERHDRKLAKSGRLTVELEATPDLSATLNAKKRPGQLAIGFALQTHDGVKNARAKLADKNLDGIVLNGLDAMGGDTGTYTWLGRRGGAKPDISPWGLLDKRDCARRILAEAARRLAG